VSKLYRIYKSPKNGRYYVQHRFLGVWFTKEVCYTVDAAKDYMKTLRDIPKSSNTIIWQGYI